MGLALMSKFYSSPPWFARYIITFFKCAVLVRHQLRTGRHVGLDLDVQSGGRRVGDVLGAELAVTLQHAEDDGLVCAALRAGGLLVGVLVLLLAADKRRIRLDRALKRGVE